MFPIVVFVVMVVLLALVSPREVEAQMARGNGNDASSSGMLHDHATMTPIVMAHPSNGWPRVDGVLDAPAWQGVVPETAFIRR